MTCWVLPLLVNGRKMREFPSGDGAVKGATRVQVRWKRAGCACFQRIGWKSSYGKEGDRRSEGREESREFHCK